MRITDWLMLLVLSLLWGGSFFFNELALQGLPVMSLVALRVVLAALVLWVAVYTRGLRAPRSWRIWAWFLVMGLLNNVLPFSLIVWGQTEITAGLASILNATTPLFIVVVIALFIHGEAVTRRKLAGVAIGFAGVVVMIGPAAIADVGGNVIAQLAVLFAALSYAIAGLYGRRFHAASIHPVVAAAGQVTMSAILLLPTAWWVDGPISGSQLSGSVVLSVLALAMLSTAVAYILYFRILSSAGAMNLMLVTFLMPVTAILLGTFLLDEPIRLLEIAGMTIIAFALIVIDGRLLRRGGVTLSGSVQGGRGTLD